MDVESPLLLVLAVTLPLGIMVWAWLWAMGTQRKANRLVELALGGRIEEARIAARKASRDVAAVLAALIDEPKPPQRTSLSKPVGFVLLSLVPALIVAFKAGGQLRNAPIHSANTLILVVGLLLPVLAWGALMIVALHRHAARMVRGSYITLLARNVKTVVEAEMVEAIRRSGPIRDPRGD